MSCRPAAYIAIAKAYISCTQPHTCSMGRGRGGRGGGSPGTPSYAHTQTRTLLTPPRISPSPHFLPHLLRLRVLVHHHAPPAAHTFPHIPTLLSTFFASGSLYTTMLRLRNSGITCASNGRGEEQWVSQTHIARARSELPVP